MRSTVLKVLWAHPVAAVVRTDARVIRRHPAHAQRLLLAAADMKQHRTLAQCSDQGHPAPQCIHGVSGFPSVPHPQLSGGKDFAECLGAGEATQAGMRHLSRAKQKKKASLHT